jgi:radical SAM protein with 4Fe4S-binding SPASM domain
MPLKKLKSEELLKSNSFCILPFVHSCVWTDGRVLPCCINHQYPLGHVKEQPLSEIYSTNNKKLVSLRKELLESDKLPKSCFRCKMVEDFGLPSIRTSTNQRLSHLIEKIEINEDNIVETESFSYWDVRFSNLCNVKCRMCDSTNSSRIAEEEVKEGKNIPVLREAFNDSDDFFKFFTSQLENLEEIYFCGGEPLLLEEHYKILDLLIEHKKFDIRIRYNSNCTKLSFKNKNVVRDYWKYFTNIVLSASIDAGWNQLSYIRNGSNWEVILNNLNLIKKECPGVRIHITPTIQILNAFYVTKLHLELVKMNIIDASGFNPITLTMPEHYSLTSLPIHIKDKMKEHWLWFKNELIQISASKATLDLVDGIINYTYSRDTQEKLVELKKETLQKDILRNEDFYQTFPELSDLFDEVQ